MLVGRREECRQLDELLSGVRRGISRTLVIRGEAGIGKSALLEYLIGRDDRYRVVQAAGVQAEAELAFAGLHQLCTPLLDRLAHIPERQQDAVGTAFGLRVGPPPDPFLFGLAVLSLLAEAAAECPLLCVIDDAQWLDRASAQTLAFVARRLGAESVALVFAIREAADQQSSLAGLPELTLGGLGAGEAREMLAAAIPGPLDERVRDRILAETRGNPLALLELPRGLTYAELAGGFGLPDAQGLSDRIEESFQRRLAPLPADLRQLLLIAAVEPTGDPALIRRAASRLGVLDRRAGAHRVRGTPSLGQHGRLPPPTRALGCVPVGLGQSAPGGAPGAGRRHRSGGRRRSPRLAPRPRRGRARRVRRRRTGALGRPRPRTRRARRGRRVPRAGGGADAGPGATSGAGPGRRRHEVPGRRVRCGAGPAWRWRRQAR